MLTEVLHWRQTQGPTQARLLTQKNSPTNPAWALPPSFASNVTK